MKVVCSPRYHIDVGPHVFPTAKYVLVCQRLVDRGLVDEQTLVEPVAATWEELGLVHTSRYLAKLRDGRLTIGEVARLELPWSPEAVEGFRLMAGGTLTAARHALADGLAVHVGGGLHHAHPDHGEGFCMFHDVAVAIRVLRRDGLAGVVAVVDADVHQGNGTAAIFAGDLDVVTLSVHQANNYPAVKPPSTLDVELPDGIGDEAYLRALAPALDAVVASGPRLAFYLAGADPYRDDQLGGLSLSFDGLRRRDAVVLSALRAAGAAVVVTLAGGYARRVDDTVAIHVATIEEAFAIAQNAL